MSPSQERESEEVIITSPSKVFRVFGDNLTVAVPNLSNKDGAPRAHIVVGEIGYQTDDFHLCVGQSRQHVRRRHGEDEPDHQRAYDVRVLEIEDDPEQYEVRLLITRLPGSDE